LGIAVDRHDNIFVADYGNHTVRLIKPSGVVSTLAGVAGQAGSADGPGAEARFKSPGGIAVDCAGRVYVSDWGNHTLRRISATGHVTTVAGAAGQEGNVDGWRAAARFHPSGLAVSANGSLYMAGASVIRSVR
jgi:DNA-binding beta-propeller fold protein YncE